MLYRIVKLLTKHRKIAVRCQNSEFFYKGLEIIIFRVNIIKLWDDINIILFYEILTYIYCYSLSLDWWNFLINLCQTLVRELRSHCFVDFFSRMRDRSIDIEFWNRDIVETLWPSSLLRSAIRSLEFCRLFGNHSFRWFWVKHEILLIECRNFYNFWNLRELWSPHHTI